MIDTERREAARQFINRWRGKGKEDEDGRSYWIELLSNIFGVENVTERIDFEKKVVVDGHTKRIDVYIPETKVIIEQKSLNVPLDKKVRNSGEVDLTAFEQADRYNSKLIFDERARWIVTCNFAEIWIYDMNERQPKPSKIMLEELQTKYSLLDFLIKKEVQKISHEMEVSIKAGEIVGLIYNAFLEQYKIPKVKKNETEVEKEKREHKLKSLNALCVRLVFCLYAEDALDELIAYNSANVAKVEQAYKLRAKCLSKLKRKKEERQNNISLADYYLDFAEKTFQKDIQGAWRAVNFYQKGIILYRNNGKPEKASAAQKRLIEIQKEIPKTMMPISIKLDIKGVVDNIKANIEGLSFEECVVRLIQMFGFEKQEDIKNRVIKEFKDQPIPHLFGKNLINAQGQTVLTLPPLDIHNPEKDSRLIELHMYQNELEKQKFIGDVWIKNALNIIRDRFVIDKPMVEFLVKDNPIIPTGRERIFQSGVYMFFNGDYYEAIHILAPQVENLFRAIAQGAGGITVTLEKDGTSMEKVLSSILSLPELMDCYDNDILFIFRGLLNERAGANIRNEIAHGIISESACSTGACLYFGMAVIKLLSLTSSPYYQILKNSEKLKHFEIPSKDTLKIIR